MFPPRLREALSLGGLSVRELALRTWKKAVENELMTRAAAVSFYAMLALVPFLGLILTLTTQLLPDLSGAPRGPSGVGHMTVGELRSTLRSLFPSAAYGVVEDQIQRIRAEPPVGLLSLGLAITIWLASSLFVAVIDAMNRICGVAETRPIWKLRLAAIAMTLVEAVILIGSLVAIVAWPQILAWAGFSAPTAALATVAQWIVVVVMILLSFALTFYVGPDADQRWEWITPGSLAGTVVVLVSSLGFRVYVQNFASYNKTYGSLGGVMVLLFWFWISSLVLLTAGQLNKVI
jgi:membrane protein